MQPLQLTAEIEKETLSTGEDVYVALCLELDIASQGATVEEARANLIEAVESFFAAASDAEIRETLTTLRRREVFTTRIEVPFAKLDKSIYSQLYYQST